MKKVSITEAKVRLPEIVSRSQYHGEIFIIQRYGKDAAVLLPIKNLEEVAPERSRTLANRNRVTSSHPGEK